MKTKNKKLVVTRHDVDRIKTLVSNWSEGRRKLVELKPEIDWVKKTWSLRRYTRAPPAPTKTLVSRINILRSPRNHPFVAAPLICKRLGH